MPILKQGESLQIKAAKSRLQAALAQLRNSTDHLEYLRERFPAHIERAEKLIVDVKVAIDAIDHAVKDVES